MINEYEMNFKRATIFFERKSVVHVSLKNGSFFNGRIHSLTSEFFELHDRMIGMQLIFFSELKKPIQEYQEEVGR